MKTAKELRVSMNKRMELRTRVYLKFNKRCAYCGRELTMKQLQIDHQTPTGTYDKGGFFTEEQWTTKVNEFENLFPACRSCNHYKRNDNLTEFRHKMKTLHERIEKHYINKVGINYGIITMKPFNGKFYFEL